MGQIASLCNLDHSNVVAENWRVSIGFGVSGFSSSTPRCLIFLFGLGRSGYMYIFFLYNIFLLVSVIPAVAKHKLNRQGCSMSGGAYWHPLTPNIYIHVSRHLLFWKFLGWTTMPAPIVEVFHPLGTFWAMTIKKKFHAVSPIVLQPHSFLNLSPVQAVLCRWTQEYVVWLRKVWPSHCHPFISKF